MTAATTSTARALSAYGASKRLNHNPKDLLLAVHEELYRVVASAKLAQEQKALDQMCLHVQRGTLILNALITNLDFTLAGADGPRLMRFYLHLAGALNRVTKSRIVTPSYQNALDLLQSFCRGLRSEINS